jgi:hypothetical protein
MMEMLPAFSAAIGEVLMCRNGVSLRGLVARLPTGPLSAFSPSLYAAILESCEEPVREDATWQSLYTDFLQAAVRLTESKKVCATPAGKGTAEKVLKPTSGDGDSPRRQVVRELFKEPFLAGLILLSIGETQPLSRERLAADAIREVFAADVVEKGFRMHELRGELSVLGTRFLSGSHRMMGTEVSEVLAQAGYRIDRAPGLELEEERWVTVGKVDVTHTFRFAANPHESKTLGMRVIFDLGRDEEVPIPDEPQCWQDSFAVGDPELEPAALVKQFEGAFVKGATGTAGEVRTRWKRETPRKGRGVDLSAGLTSGAIAMVWGDQRTRRAVGAVTGLSSGMFLALKEVLQLLVNAGLAGGPEALVMFNTEVAGGLKEFLRTIVKKATMGDGSPLPEEIEREVLALKLLLTAGADLAPRNVLFGLFFDQVPAPKLPSLKRVLRVLECVYDASKIRKAASYVLGAIEVLGPDSASGRLVCISRDEELRIEFATDFFEVEAVRRIADPVEVSSATLTNAKTKYGQHVDATALQLKYFLLAHSAERARRLGYVDAALWAKAFKFEGAATELDGLSKAIAAADERVTRQRAYHGNVELWPFTLSFAFEGLDEQAGLMKAGLDTICAAVAG